MLIFVHNQATNILPLILGLFFKINGTGSRVVLMLSNIGLSVSGQTIERLKKQISDDAIAHARKLVTSSEGLFCTIFDNINIYQHKFQQRITNQNSMIHTTNVVILRIDTDGLDASRAIHLQTMLEMRGLRSKATIKDIMPSDEDDAHMKKSYTCLIAQLLVLYSPDSGEWTGRAEILGQLKEMMPQDRPLKAQKTDARPFGVIDINEGSKRGIVDVLKEIGVRTSLTPQEWSSKTRLILGDWLTSSNLRAAHRDRFDEKSTYENLSYAKELSQPWHFALQATLRARQHFPSAKILRTCVYGTPYSILGAPDDYMEYRKYMFFEFSQQENASCLQCHSHNHSHSSGQCCPGPHLTFCTQGPPQARLGCQQTKLCCC